MYYEQWPATRIEQIGANRLIIVDYDTAVTKDAHLMMVSYKVLIIKIWNCTLTSSSSYKTD